MVHGTGDRDGQTRQTTGTLQFDLTPRYQQYKVLYRYMYTCTYPPSLSISRRIPTHNVVIVIDMDDHQRICAAGSSLEAVQGNEMPAFRSRSISGGGGGAGAGGVSCVS
jgi:hypothetical protein